jgi:VWFA-related protein
MRRLPVAVVVAAVVAATFAFSQESEPLAQETEPLIKVDVDLVNVLFAVRDKKGALVPGLTQEDFKVYEDGKEQTIRSFVRESDLPLTIGLLVDVSGSQRNLIEVEKHAATQFFQQVLRKKDMAFLISFGSEAELLQDSTNSVPLLTQGLDELKGTTSIGAFGGMGGPVPTIPSKARGTILFDAVSLAATEKLTHEVGRKAMVLITDGVDQGSRYDVRQAIEAAHKADAIIYSIQYMDHSAYGSFGASDSDLKKMSEETGGRMFRVDRKHSLKEIFEQIQQEMRSQYALSYTPTNTERNGEFRKLEIKPVRKDLKVQARKGYYAGRS